MLQTAYTAITDNLHRFMVPVCLLCVLRIAVCFIELARIKQLREKKNRFLSCKNQYTEIPGEAGMLIGSVLACLIPKLWPLFIPVGIVLCVIGCKQGKKKAAEVDAYWREVGLEMKRLNQTAIETEDTLAIEGTAAVIQAVEDYGEEEEKKETEN